MKYSKPTSTATPASEESASRYQASGCLCCSNTGLIHPRFCQELIKDYNPLLDPMVLCQNCESIYATNDRGAPIRDKEGTQVTRYPLDGIWRFVSPSDCRAIHDREFQFCQDLERRAASNAGAIAQSAKIVGREMSGVSKKEVEPWDLIAEAAGVK